MLVGAVNWTLKDRKKETDGQTARFSLRHVRHCYGAEICTKRSSSRS